MVRADEDAAPGAELARPGRPLRAAGPRNAGRRRRHRDRRARAPARDHRLDRRRAGARRRAPTADPGPGPRLLRPRPGRPGPRGRRRAQLRRHRARRPRSRAPSRCTKPSSVKGLPRGCDVLVVSAGSSVGARDETAAAIASLGEPGIWCHGLSLKPGQADAARRHRRRAGDRAARQSALGARRLPPDRDADRPAWWAAAPSPRRSRPSAPASPATCRRRPVASTSSRYASLASEAEPLFGSSSLLSILTAADGYLVVPEAATGLAAGSEVEWSGTAELLGRPTSLPSRRDGTPVDELDLYRSSSDARTRGAPHERGSSRSVLGRLSGPAAGPA